MVVIKFNVNKCKMTVIYEIAFYGLAVSFIFVINLACYYKSKQIEKSKNNKSNLSVSPSLSSFDNLQIIEDGEQKLRQVYSNGTCPHCGEYINLNSGNPRYFAFDCNICKVCYWKFMKKAGK